jgi:hypothetical protein
LFEVKYLTGISKAGLDECFSNAFLKSSSLEDFEELLFLAPLADFY